MPVPRVDRVGVARIDHESGIVCPPSGRRAGVLPRRNVCKAIAEREVCRFFASPVRHTRCWVRRMDRDAPSTPSVLGDTGCQVSRFLGLNTPRLRIRCRECGSSPNPRRRLCGRHVAGPTAKQTPPAGSDDAVMRRGSGAAGRERGPAPGCRQACEGHAPNGVRIDRGLMRICRPWKVCEVRAR